MKRAILMMVAALMVVACGEADVISDHQMDKVSISAGYTLECKGDGFNRDFAEKGRDYGAVPWVKFTGKYVLKQQGDNLCRQSETTSFQLNFENANSSAEKGYAVSAKEFSFTSTDDGLTLKEIDGSGALYTVWVTTSSSNSLVVAATLDNQPLEGNALKGMDQAIQAGSVATYYNVPSGLFAVNCRINQADSDKLESCVKDGAMAYPLWVSTNAQPVPTKLTHYVIQDEVEKPACQLTLTGVCKSLGDDSSLIDFDDGNGPDGDDDPDDPTGGIAFPSSVVHVGYTGDAASWQQASVTVFRMVGVAETVSLYSDPARTAGTVARVQFSGVVSSSQSEQHYRQVRLTIGSLVIGEVYVLEYCLYSGAGGRVSVEVHQTSGQPGQPWPNAGIYIQDIVLAPGVYFCDGWEFESLLDTAQYLTFHTANLSGDFRLDDARVRLKP